MTLRKYIVGNWKMNGVAADLGEARQIAVVAGEAMDFDVALCPPATLLAPMVAVVSPMAVGGQDCHSEAAGAFTGSVSATMLRDAGARFTIVGHSERREGCGESDTIVRGKADAAFAAELDVILCVGEPIHVREAAEAEAVVLRQLNDSLPQVPEGRTLTVAYEPIWAIGTGLVATPDDVRIMHATIRSKLRDFYGADAGDSVRILYGGSVNGDNAAQLFAVDNVDGALVGGASLTAAKFGPIIAAARSSALSARAGKGS